jgi:tRNA pseudouridine38-40 synthase
MRIAFGISYQGSAYHGWQTQTGLASIQSCLEQAVAKLADHPVSLTCAGRTDKGVHALGQVVHFDSRVERSQAAWLLGCNSHLPADIRVDWVQSVPIEFHARFSALARRYRYIIYNQPLNHALWNKHSTHCYYPLDELRMQSAANDLMGEHDFSSFRAASCQAKNAIRHVQHFKVIRYRDYVLIDIQANAFLHHMVRNMAGVLMCIGAGKKPIHWAKEVLLAKDRRIAAATARPNGLYLVEVLYPEKFAIAKPRNDFFSVI